MPQIHVTIGPDVLNVFTKDKLETLEEILISVVEKGFDLVGLSDVSFTAVPALCIKGEKDVQIEVRYTAGKDEYDRGKPFDPSEEEKEKLAKSIKEHFSIFANSSLQRHMDSSVWCIPYYNTVFKA